MGESFEGIEMRVLLLPGFKRSGKGFPEKLGYNLLKLKCPSSVSHIMDAMVMALEPNCKDLKIVHQPITKSQQLKIFQILHLRL
ncbi:hypothetical protein MRB53_028273 [Persea americana]|uniref:Uncharacterized protein n=1 Tax=Persea americana TaxID=3435 RepID=A0ACC2KF50_PERAE|nr:hypothetical protein MRB53_028273 [Persea americana]